MYTVLNMGWTPSKWLDLNVKEKAFVIACILTKVEEEKKQAKEMKNKGKSRRK